MCQISCDFIFEEIQSMSTRSVFSFEDGNGKLVDVSKVKTPVVLFMLISGKISQVAHFKSPTILV